MPLVVTQPQTNTGVFGVLQQPPSSVVASTTNTAVLVGQFPWGPINSLQYPGGAPGGQYLSTYAPNGSVRTGASASGHLAAIRKAWGRLGVIRALPANAVKATTTITASGPTNILTLVAKYEGTTGNSITATVSAASDGNANHFNLTVTLSGASGFTTELYQNLNISGTGADVLPNLANSALLLSATKLLAGLPQLQAFTFSTGTSPALTSTQYVGTPGGNDFGFALCEQDQAIDHLLADDCGNSLRAAVNAGLLAHVALTTNKVGYLNGNSAQAASAAQTDAASYRSTNIVYVDPWAYVYDDVTGAQQLTSGAAWAASVASQIPPSLDIGCRFPQVTAMFAGIAQLEAQRGPSARAANTLAGISTLTGLPQGGYSFEGGFNTSGIAGETDLTWTRMGIYLFKSVVGSWGPFVNAPNIAYYQQDLVNSLDTFLRQLAVNAGASGGGNPAFLPFINAYRILSPSQANTPASIASNAYTVAAQVQYGAIMRQIYFQLQGGAGVSITQN